MTMLWPDHASHDEKVKQLFDDFDARRTGTLDDRSWVEAFQRLHVGFSPATLTDLFDKSDANGDKRVSFPEFQRFGELYPTLVDCMYYRAKDSYTERAQKEAIDAARRVLDDLRAREEAASDAYAQSQVDTQAAQRNLEHQQQSVADAESREHAAKAQLAANHDETERSRAALHDCINEVNRAKDHERQLQMVIAEAQRAVEVAGRRLAMQEQEAAKAENRLREIERLLQQQQREADLQHRNVDRCRTELEQAHENQQEAAAAANEARRQVHDAAARAAEAEADVAARQETERRAAAALRDASNEVARQVTQCQAHERDLRTAGDRESMRKTEAIKAGDDVDAQLQNIDFLEQETVDFAARRRAVDDDEQPLMDQEVRLREQRDSLETKETKLRHDFQTFSGRSVRPGSPVRGNELPVRGYERPVRVIEHPARGTDPSVRGITHPVRGVEHRTTSKIVLKSSTVGKPGTAGNSFQGPPTPAFPAATPLAPHHTLSNFDRTFSSVSSSDGLHSTR